MGMSNGQMTEGESLIIKAGWTPRAFNARRRFFPCLMTFNAQRGEGEVAAKREFRHWCDIMCLYDTEKLWLTTKRVYRSASWTILWKKKKKNEIKWEQIACFRLEISFSRSVLFFRWGFIEPHVHRGTVTVHIQADEAGQPFMKVCALHDAHKHTRTPPHAKSI